MSSGYEYLCWARECWSPNDWTGFLPSSIRVYWAARWPLAQDLTILLSGQVFKLHCEEGWFNRRTHQLTKFQLRRQAQSVEFIGGIEAIKVQVLTCLDFTHLVGGWERNLVNFCLSGCLEMGIRWKPSLQVMTCRGMSWKLNSSCRTKEHALHLYNKDLPVVLLHGPELPLKSFAKLTGKPAESLNHVLRHRWTCLLRYEAVYWG